MRTRQHPQSPSYPWGMGITERGGGVWSGTPQGGGRIPLPPPVQNKKNPYFRAPFSKIGQNIPRAFHLFRKNWGVPVGGSQTPLRCCGGGGGRVVWTTTRKPPLTQYPAWGGVKFGDPKTNFGAKVRKKREPSPPG